MQMTNTSQSTSALVRAIVTAEQDFEWYPTTTEIIDAVKNHINQDEKYFGGTHRHRHLSVLDCGAGDGRVLMALTDGDKYAIEKSDILLQQMDREIYIVGTDFNHQTLIDKPCDVVFSNPPYKYYAEWMIRIIKEANASSLYFVVPQRWSSNKEICEALAWRKVEAEVVGSFDFCDAERAARAKVEIVHVSLRRKAHTTGDNDAFNRWFDDAFPSEISPSKKEATAQLIENEMVPGADLLLVMERLYQGELGKLMACYKSLTEIDPDLLMELGVSKSQIAGGLRLKIAGLKHLYWKELFSKLDKITNRLTSDSRRKILEKMMARTNVDFTAENARAIVIWIIKNANSYLDDQLIKLVERMTYKANIKLYKSNKVTFGDDRWRYCRKPENLDRYALDYRIVMSSHSAICGYHNDELSYQLVDFINDLLTVANNIGFDTTQTDRAVSKSWQSGVARSFDYANHAKAQRDTLLRVKAFKNGNIHIQLAPLFICKLNVEFGRLMGWLKNKEEAAFEIGISEEIVSEAFQSNHQFVGNNVQYLLMAS